MQTYEIIITGTSPLIAHADNIEWSDGVEEWRQRPENKKYQRPGDDRVPAWTWIGCFNRDETKRVVMPTENLMRCMSEGAAMVSVGRGAKTFKSQSQSGIQPTTYGWPILIGGEPIDDAKLDELLKVDIDFKVHKATVLDLGFYLFMKRAKIGTKKHVRVRPRLSNWSMKGELIVIDDQITYDVLYEILRCAGRYKGLGDWRPGSKTPGVYGMFDVKVTAKK